MKNLVILLVFYLAFVESYFDPVVDRLEIFEQDENFIDWSALKVRKINKTRMIVGEIVYKVPMGNEIMIETKIYKKQGGEYRLTPFRIEPQPLCVFFENDEYIYKDLAAGSELPAPETMKDNCPLKPRTYKVFGIVPRLTNVPKIILPSGDYAAEAIYKKNKKNILRVRIYGTIVQI